MNGWGGGGDTHTVRVSWVLISVCTTVSAFFFFLSLSLALETSVKVWKAHKLQKLNAFSCLDGGFDAPIICVMLEEALKLLKLIGKETIPTS